MDYVYVKAITHLVVGEDRCVLDTEVGVLKRIVVRVWVLQSADFWGHLIGANETN